MTPADPLSLALVPAWRRPAFWLMFAGGAVWGAVLGSALVATGRLWVLPAGTALGRTAQQSVEGAASVVRRTQPGASATVWLFTIASGALIASLGIRHFRRFEPGGPGE